MTLDLDDINQLLGDRSWGLLQEIVNGRDDRSPVANTKLRPWSMICSLKIVAGDGKKYQGTGAIIAPNKVLTAGHNLFKAARGGMSMQVEVIPGQNGPDTKPFGSSISRKFSLSEKWLNDSGDNNIENDLGCIHLSTPIMGETGSFQYSPLPTHDLSGQNAYVAGYPLGDWENRSYDGNSIYIAQDKFMNMDESSKILSYKTDTISGNSGSPVWILGDSNLPILVGIHVSGDEDKKVNYAIRMTNNVVEQIRGWIQA
jgi:glutamyl endopeptidase